MSCSMTNQLETINKFLEYYETTAQLISTSGKYNKFSFKILTISEYDGDSKTLSLAGEVEEHFHGIYNSFECTTHDPNNPYIHCLITLGAK